MNRKDKCCEEWKNILLFDKELKGFDNKVHLMVTKNHGTTGMKEIENSEDFQGNLYLFVQTNLL